MYNFGKLSKEGGTVGKSALGNDLLDRQIGLFEQILRFLDAAQ